MSSVPVWWPESVDEVIAAMADGGGTPQAVRLTGSVLTALPDEVREGLSTTSWIFLVGGWSEPILASLPPSSRSLQVGREVEELTAWGLSSLVGLVPNGWEPGLASLFTAQGIHQVAVGADPPLTRPVVTDYLGDVVTILPLCIDPPSLILPSGEVERAQPPVDRAWARVIDADPEADLLYRKMLRLATRLPERPPAEAVDQLLEAQASRWYLGHIDRTPAHAALIGARRRLDQERRVPPEWSKFTRLDWDADGVIEAHLENRELSMVVDPAEGLIKVVDLKLDSHPLSYLPDQSPWRIARVLAGGEAHRLRLELEAVEAARDHLRVRMTGPDLVVTLDAAGDDIGFAYQLGPGFEFDRLGPEMTLALGAEVRMRVDGGAWITLPTPAAHLGHRFRLQGGGRQVLISLAQPGDLFVSPVEGGIVVWANWPVRPGEYRLSASLTG